MSARGGMKEVTTEVAMEAEEASHKRKRSKKSTTTAVADFSSSTSEAVDSAIVTRVLQSLPRSQLETLVFDSVRTNAPISFQCLEQALPVGMQWKARKSDSKSVSMKGASRIGTGSFDAIDDEIMQLILLFLPLQDRVVCATHICKPWRDFKHNVVLWKDLTTFSDRSKHDATDYVRAEWILELLEWLPNPEHITALMICSLTNCNPNSCKAIIKKLATCKKPKKNHQVRPAPLNKLIVSGPKITPAVINALVKENSLVGPSLTSFTLSNVKVSKLADTIPGLLEKCPNLCEMQLATDAFLNITLNRLYRARGNNPTLLRVLDLSACGFSFHTPSTSVTMMSSLANTCPELEVLKLNQLTGIPLQPFPAKYQARSMSVSVPDTFLADPMQPLLRLKTFQVGQISMWSYSNSAVLQRLFPWLLAGMPVLEDFSFSNGSYYLSVKERKTLRFPDYPSPGRLSMLPRTIRRLDLGFLSLEAGDLDAILPDLCPCLEHVQLQYCGAAMVEIAWTLKARYGFPGPVVQKMSGHDYDESHAKQLATGMYSTVVVSTLPSFGIPGDKEILSVGEGDCA